MHETAAGNKIDQEPQSREGVDNWKLLQSVLRCDKLMIDFNQISPKSALAPINKQTRGAFA
jgi:hypothetical protein